MESIECQTNIIRKCPVIHSRRLPLATLTAARLRGCDTGSRVVICGVLGTLFSVRHARVEGPKLKLWTAALQRKNPGRGLEPVTSPSMRCWACAGLLSSAIFRIFGELCVTPQRGRSFAETWPLDGWQLRMLWFDSIDARKCSVQACAANTAQLFTETSLHTTQPLDLGRVAFRFRDQLVAAKAETIT